MLKQLQPIRHKLETIGKLREILETEHEKLNRKYIEVKYESKGVKELTNLYSILSDAGIWVAVNEDAAKSIHAINSFTLDFIECRMDFLSFVVENMDRDEQFYENLIRNLRYGIRPTQEHMFKWIIELRRRRHDLEVLVSSFNQILEESSEVSQLADLDTLRRHFSQAIEIPGRKKAKQEVIRGLTNRLEKTIKRFYLYRECLEKTQKEAEETQIQYISDQTMFADLWRDIFEEKG